jgi:hypothetical protein
VRPLHEVSYAMKPATCHPDRKHVARGLCSACYNRERYQDPEYRARQRERHQDPEYRARQRERDRLRRQDPEYLDRQRERARELRQDPEYRARKNERLRARRAALKASKVST